MELKTRALHAVTCRLRSFCAFPDKNLDFCFNECVSGLRCEVCAKKLSSANHLRSHMEKNHNVKLLACDKCRFKFLSQSELDDHVATKHDKVTGVYSVPKQDFTKFCLADEIILICTVYSRAFRDQNLGGANAKIADL